MKFYVRVTALVLGALFLFAVAAAAVELWREGDLSPIRSSSAPPRD